MTIIVKKEWRQYVTEKFDEEKCEMTHTVSVSKTPKEILKEMRQINKRWRDVGYHGDTDFFTFVD